MNVLSRKEVLHLLHDVLEKENLSDVAINIASGSGKGEGYTSYITKVDVIGTKKTRHFIIKSTCTDAEFLKLIPIDALFNREIYFYDTIYPALRKFQADRNLKRPFRAAPECFKTVNVANGEKLVLDNIRERGFELWNRKLQMDEEHIKLIFSEYAKLHAVSFAMQDQDQTLYERLTSNLVDIMKLMPDHIKHHYLDIADNAIELFEEQPEVKEKLKKLKAGIMPMFEFIWDNKFKYNVICHGDCWCTNMMINYQENKPAEVCLLDFQIVKAASPVLDVSYFYYASASYALYDKLEEHLKFYHHVLAEQLTAMGSDVNKLYPYSAFIDDWKAFAKYGFIMSLNLAKMLIKEDDELLDFTDIAGTGRTFSDVFLKDSKNVNIANERIRAMTMHMVKNQFI